MASVFKAEEDERDERLRLRDFLAAIDLFADLEPNMPLQMLRAFVVTAMYEGEFVKAIAEKAGMDPPIMSQKQPGHDFIELRVELMDRAHEACSIHE